MFQTEPGNGRIGVWQLDEQGRPLRRYMDLVIGKSSSLATNKPLPPSNNQDMTSVGDVTMDNRHQRLFVRDGIRVNEHEPRNRLLVFDVHPDRLTDHAEAIAVIGQPDFETNTTGVGPAEIGGGVRSAINEADDWLFVADGANNRILIFDVDPERLQNGSAAIAVLGQPDFGSRDAGIGRSGLNRPAFLAYDPAYRRLFVSDAGNRRILVFDVPRDGIQPGQEAIAVLGQSDFESREARSDPRKATPADLAIEPETQRLLVSEIGNNRILVFDVHPDRLESNPDAIAVIGQPDFEYAEFDPIVARNTTRSPHQVAIDSRNQLIYMVDGFSGRNAVTIFDINPDRLENQPEAIDVLGKLNDAGEPDFERRPANDVINGRFNAEIRSLALDKVDHRLIAGDQYNHRVIVWQLDEDNRIGDPVAQWAIGQPDVDSSFLRERSAKNLKKPYALAYDHEHKRLFIAETLSDRVTVWDLHPDRMTNYPEALAVIGQRDFETRLPQRTRRGLFLGDSMGHGIGSGGPRPTGLAMDDANQRLFVADGANHRVMIYDVDPERLENHPEAIAVLGQPDYSSGLGAPPGANSVDSTALTTAVQGSRARESSSTAAVDRLFWPSALDYDARHGRLFVADGSNNRVMVFSADPARLQNGDPAIAVLGQTDFISNQPGRSQSQFKWPDGIAYDSIKDHLYVTDKGNDRVLVFDVAPERLENGADAVAVIGQSDFDSWWAGPEQEQLSDPRDIEFDSEQQRLFVADSYQTRVVTFDMPSTERAFEVKAHAAKRYSTLDWKHSARTEGYASAALDRGEGVHALTLLSLSDEIMDPVSERESRLLHGEVAIAPSTPSRQTLIYVSPSDNTRVIVRNPTDTRANLEITFGDLSGRSRGRANRVAIDPGVQEVADASDLLGRTIAEEGVLRIESDVPVIVHGLLMNRPETELVVAAAPMAQPGDAAGGYLNIPRIEVGAGYESQVVLLNPFEDTLRGSLFIRGLKGGIQIESYSIAPNGAYVWRSGAGRGLARTGYIIIRGEGALPAVGGALVGLYDEDRLVSRTYVPARGVSRTAWIPVDTHPTTTRHGRADVVLNVVNVGADPAAAANLRINLFAPDGTFVERFEQNLPIGERWDISLVELSKRNRFRGTVRVVSNPPVVVSAMRVTENVQGDLVEVELPVTNPDRDRSGDPLWVDGDGIASEIILLNTNESVAGGSLRLFSGNGQPREMILR